MGVGVGIGMNVGLCCGLAIGFNGYGIGVGLGIGCGMGIVLSVGLSMWVRRDGVRLRKLPAAGLALLLVHKASLMTKLKILIGCYQLLGAMGLCFGVQAAMSSVQLSNAVLSAAEC